MKRKPMVVSMRGIVACVLLTGILLPVSPKMPLIPAEYFVDDIMAEEGDCTQGNPCYLATALAKSAPATIYLAAGTYTGTGNEVIYLSTHFNLFGGWDGTTAYPPVHDPDTYVSIIDGENARRGISIIWSSGDPLSPVITGLIIEKGDATGKATGCLILSSGTPDGCGGGIYVSQATPFIHNNVIHNNKASTSISNTGYGGGIYMQYSNGAQIIENRIYSNVASQNSQGLGGGVALHEGGVNTEFDHNLVYQNNGGCSSGKSCWGAGLALAGDSSHIFENEIYDNGISDTVYVSGGGIYLWYGSPVIENNLITGNYGDAAVYLGYTSNARFRSNRILNNSSDAGLELIYTQKAGATCTDTDNVYVYNNFISGENESNLFATGSPDYPLCARVYHNTLDGAQKGVVLDTMFDFIFVNNIISNHSTIGIDVSTAANTPVLSHNLFYNNSNNGLVGLSDLFGDPHYINPVTNNFHIWCDSAAVDKGDSAIDVGIDIDGETRPIGSGSDIGADECSPMFYLPLIKRN